MQIKFKKSNPKTKKLASTIKLILIYLIQKKI